MKTHYNDKPRKQRSFNADLIPIVAATGFTAGRRRRSKPLTLADWARGPAIRRPV